MLTLKVLDLLLLCESAPWTGWLEKRQQGPAWCSYQNHICWFTQALAAMDSNSFTSSTLPVVFQFHMHLTLIFLTTSTHPPPKKKISLPLMFIRFHCFTGPFPPPTTSLTAERLASKPKTEACWDLQLHTQDGSGNNDRPEAMSMSTSDALAERCVEIGMCWGGRDGWDFFARKKGKIFFFREKKHKLY